MKKYIAYILIFFVAVLVIDQLVGLAGDYMQHHSKPGPNKQFDDLCLNDEYDIIVMGSSRAHHHYVPQVLQDSLGLDVYNAGYDGNGIILAYGILQMITERYSPKCIIYDIEPTYDFYVYDYDKNMTRYLSTLKRYRPHEGVADMLKDISWETYLMSFSGLCKYNSSIIYSIKQWLFGGLTYDNGYEPLCGELPPDYIISHADYGMEIDNIKANYFHKFIHLCEDNDIELVLALSPEYGVGDNNIERYVEDLSVKNNLKLINCYSDEFFKGDPSLFKDSRHLNDNGAILFTKKILPFIRNCVSKIDL